MLSKTIIFSVKDLIDAMFLKIFNYWCKQREIRLIALEGRVFANGPRDLGSIPGRVIPKTLKSYSIPPCLTLSNIRNVKRVKWSNPGKGVAPYPTPRYSCHWKGSPLVALDYGRQLYFYYEINSCSNFSLDVVLKSSI